MKLSSVCKLSALSLVAAMTCSSVSAYADQAPGDVGTPALSDVDLSGFVASADPVEVAGLLNYCTETNYVSYDDGFQVLQSYNKKTNAVPEGQEGNMNYARGTAGQMLVNGKTYSLPMSVVPVREKACKAVLARAKAAL